MSWLRIISLSLVWTVQIEVFNWLGIYQDEFENELNCGLTAF